MTDKKEKSGRKLELELRILYQPRPFPKTKKNMRQHKKCLISMYLINYKCERRWSREEGGGPEGGEKEERRQTSCYRHLWSTERGNITA